MKASKNPVLVVLALVGLCAILYGVWNLYQRQVSREKHHQKFSAPVPPGLPNFLNATPGAPPPQP